MLLSAMRRLHGATAAARADLSSQTQTGGSGDHRVRARPGCVLDALGARIIDPLYLGLCALGSGRDQGQTPGLALRCWLHFARSTESSRRAQSRLAAASGSGRLRKRQSAARRPALCGRPESTAATRVPCISHSYPGMKPHHWWQRPQVDSRAVPAYHYGIVEIGDHVLYYDYAPALTFNVAVKTDGTLHQRIGNLQHRRQDRAWPAHLRRVTPVCTSHFFGRFKLNHS